MDGTSGALYAIFLNNLTHYARSRATQAVVVDTAFWAQALQTAASALSKYTPAQVGDRTVMDALIPFVDSLSVDGELGKAAAAAAGGATKTRQMRPGLGRSVYIGNQDAWLGKVPDPGAWGLSKFFSGLI